MVLLAAGYGLLLGAAQFYLIKALVKYAIAQRGGSVKLPAALPVGLAGYVAAALGAVFLFQNQLAAAAVGLGSGFFAAAGIWLARKIKQLK